MRSESKIRMDETVIKSDWKNKKVDDDLIKIT